MDEASLKAGFRSISELRAEHADVLSPYADFVPEGRCDRSLARSAWDIANPKEPSRRVRSDSCSVATSIR
jgi:hypothetical protein